MKNSYTNWRQEEKKKKEDGQREGERIVDVKTSFFKKGYNFSVFKLKKIN